MSTYHITDLNDLAIPFENRSAPTLIDSAITLPSAVQVLGGFTLTIGGLEATDSVNVRSGSGFASGGTIVITAGIVEGFFGLVGTFSSGPGSFSLTFSPGVPRGVAERAIEELQFATTDGRSYSTRSLTYTLTSNLDTISGSSTLTIGTEPPPPPPSPATLTNLEAAAYITEAALMMQGPQVLDRDVTLTLEQGVQTIGTAVTVTGMVEGDTVMLRMQGAGSPFAFTQDSDGSFILYHEGDQIGTYSPGYNNGTESPFSVVFTSNASAAIIETVIENLQFTSTATGGSTRDLTISYGASSEQTPYFHNAITVNTVPGFGSLRDVAGFLAEPYRNYQQTSPVNLDTNWTLPDGINLTDGRLVISGLQSNERLNIEDVDGQDVISMSDQISQIFVYFFDSTIATASYVQTETGQDFVLDFGTLANNMLIERVLRSLILQTVGNLSPQPSSRELTFSFYDAADTLAVHDSMTVNVGSLQISQFTQHVDVTAGEEPVLLGSGMTFDGPFGYNYANSRIELLSESADNNFTVLTSDMIRMDDEGRVFYGFGGGTQIGTFAAAADSASVRAAITLNADATPDAIQALVNSLGMSRNVLALTGNTANVQINFLAGDGTTHHNSYTYQTANLTPGELPELRQALYYNTEGGAQRIDYDVDLGDGEFTDWALFVTGFNPEEAAIEVDVNSVAGNYYFIQGTTTGGPFTPSAQILRFNNAFTNSDSIVGLVYSTTDGMYIVPHRAGQSLDAGGYTWTADAMEHLIESLSFTTSGTQNLTLNVALSTQTGIYFQDSIEVINGPSVPALNGLASTVTINPLHDALNGGPALIDSDVTVPEELGTAPITLTVSGMETGDVVGIRAPGDGSTDQLSMDFEELYFGSQLLGTVSGGNGTALSISFVAGTSPAMIEAVVEALTFTSREPAASRELAITLSDANGPVVRGLIDVVVVRTPLIGDLSPRVNFDPNLIAATPIVIDNSVTLPAGEYSQGSLVVTGFDMHSVRIGLRSGDPSAPDDLWVDTRGYVYLGATPIALDQGVLFGPSNTFQLNFGPSVTRAMVERVIEALTFTTTNTNAPITLNIRFDTNTSRLFESTVVMTPRYGDQTLTGTPDADTLTGNVGNDMISGLEAHDLLGGGGGHDQVYGGQGNDTLYGAGGQDSLYGDDGDDLVFGGSGHDSLQGGIGNDTLNGNADHDRLFGGEGSDLLSGQSGDDLLYGGNGDDLLYGGDGNDRAIGGEGHDTMYGGADGDVLYGLAGDDLLTGGVGDDLLYGGIGNDSLSGGDGQDTVNGDAGNDSLAGGAGDDLLTGGVDDDLLSGGIGNDSLGGGEGHDTVQGEAGNDALGGWSGDDLLTGGVGDDLLYGGIGNDSLSGGDGQDTVNGDAGNDLLGGGAGNDAVFGGSGADSLYGAEGSDTLAGGRGADLLDGGAGEDAFVFARGDLGTGADRIARFEQGKDMIWLDADVTTWLQSGGGSAADALVWNATSRELSLNLSAVGLTGQSIVIASFTDSSELTLTAADVLFL